MPSKLQRIYRKRLKPKTITMMGVKMATGLEWVTKDIRKALYREVYEDAEVILVNKHLKLGDRVLEIGGGIGLVSLLCVKHCGEGNVHTFEPNPRAVKTILHNYSLNGLKPNVTQAALSLQDGEIEFFLNDNIFSSSLLKRENTSLTKVPTRDIRIVMQEVNPTVVVMDVEGAELDILPNATSESVRMIMVELHPHIVGEQKIATLIAQMDKLGYKITEKASAKVVVFERSTNG